MTESVPVDAESVEIGRRARMIRKRRGLSQVSMTVRLSVDDVTDAVLRACAASAAGRVNIGSGIASRGCAR